LRYGIYSTSANNNFFQVAFAEEHLTQFTWFVSEPEEETAGPAAGDAKRAKPNQHAANKTTDVRWIERSRGYLYRPGLSDLGRRLRLDVTPARADHVGNVHTLVSKVRSGFPWHQLILSIRKIRSTNPIRVKKTAFQALTHNFFALMKNKDKRRFY
jgi:hypothetical protein